ncbi:unnamed protein product [Rotaria sordida]|uniref:UDP-N-acetylglucosamine--peptide N-acetylglucosaminyltransferase SPINDLY n=2 Tax=Rotaria sordida TaxID=392033 RepID=A0A815JLN5_9BILA|nr:unnamed protein product [Rotaria sordida]CAF1479254.1 unnamed protein product [Rotaria sordida]CAF3893578.1 unnamed protein product [Rotaria sordida]CAF4145605.1 unnamed protein product [Rotaria sordida]
MTDKSLNTASISQNDQHRFIQNFIVIWLESNINEMDDLIIELRRHSDLVFTFNESDLCAKFLKNVHDQKVFLIVSNTLANAILPLVHDLSQLDSVYILCKNKTMENNWTKKWRKVREIFDDISFIFPQLQRNTRLCEESLMPVNIITETSTINLNEIQSSFMYTQLLKEIFIEMKHDAEMAKQFFVDFLHNLYADNTVLLNAIDEFKRTYEDHSPIWWYTKEEFIFSMLNRALRTQDIDVLMKMAFFIRDLHQQIVQLHFETNHTTKMIVYRGQGMFHADFEKLKKSHGGLISFNNFLSTSTNESVSHLFADCSRFDPNLIGVLFEIEIDPMISSVPFASLDHISYYSSTEKEILFSMHTILRIGDMHEIENRLWKIKLTLTNDNDEQLKYLTDYIRREIGGGSHYHRLGWLMITLNEYDKAEKIYTKLLETTAIDDWEICATLYNQLGLIYANTGKDKKALEFYDKAIKNYQKASSTHFSLYVTYSNIAFVYKSMGKYETALSMYNNAREIEEKIPLTKDSDWAITHNNIASVYRLMGDFSNALSHHQTALEIRKEVLPPNHPSLGLSFNNLGVIYHSKGDYKTALVNYHEALEIYRKSLPIVHPRPAETYNNIGFVYDSMGDYSNALLYYQKALEIQEKSLPLMHRDLATTHRNMGCTCAAIGDYSKALECFQKALNMQKTALSSTHPDLAITYNNIGFVYDTKDDYQIALEYYQKALDIQQKSLSITHPDLAMTYKNIGGIHSSMKDYSKALSYYEKALEIEQITLSSNHSRLATTYSNIGVAHQYMGDYKTAMSYFLKALEIQRKSLSPTHPDLAHVYNNMGAVQGSLGNYSIALLCYKKVLEIREKSLPAIHIDLAIIHLNIGITHYRMKNYSTALLHFQKTFEIQEKIFSPTHIILADICDKIAMTYYSMENYSNALSHYQNALNIRQKSSQSIHPDTAVNFYNIAKTFEHLNQYHEAVEYAQKAVDMARLLFGCDHSEVKENQEYLDKLRQKL